MNFLRQENEYLNTLIISSCNDLKYLSLQRSVNSFMKNHQDKALLLEDMILMSQSHKDFMQVRFIDEKGYEQVRVNLVDDNPLSVGQFELQNKSHRPYFKNTVEVKNGEIYISPIDLNIERKKVEIPFQRVIRFGTPIKQNDTLLGVIVINRYLNNFFAKMEARYKKLQSNFMLLNSSGYYLLASENYTFGFQFDSLQQESLQYQNPDIFTQIQELGNEGNITYNDVAYIFKKSDLQLELNIRNPFSGNVVNDKANQWLFLIKSNVSEIDNISSFRKYFIFSYILLTLSIILLIYFIANYRHKEKMHIIKIDSLNKSLEHKVEERTIQLASKNKELKSVNEELEAFSYSVSHDLRAPLRHITGYIDLLNKKFAEQFSSDSMRYFDNIKKASIEMGVLIENLLEFSKLSRVKLTKKLVCTDSLVHSIIESIKEDFQDKQIHFEIEKLPDVYADMVLLRQVWYNLIHNAVKYSSKNDLIEIKIHATINSDYTTFSIQDNGVGFDMQFQNKLFGTFQRLHDNSEFAGIGIGLALVKRIILRHDGLIWAESTLGKGATFYFKLPTNLQ